MIRLLYCSQAKPDFTKETLDEILLISRKNNSTAGITGVLVHGGGMFMQVLDTTIANVSLPTIAGNLGVSNNQSTWVFRSLLHNCINHCITSMSCNDHGADLL